MKKILLLFCSHAVVLAVGFALGVYFLPILIAPPAPSESSVNQVADNAQHKGVFRRDLKGSDGFHWGEGDVYVNATDIAFSGELAPGPDYKLYLSPQFVETEEDFLALKSQMAYVGDVKTFNNFMIAVPETLNINAFNTVIIWCESFSEFISAGRYR